MDNMKQSAKICVYS